MNTSLLKGEIVAKYGSQKNFCAEIGWDKNKLSRLMTKKYVPDVQEATKIGYALDLPADKMVQIFLR